MPKPKRKTKSPRVNFKGLDTATVQKILLYFSTISEQVFEYRCIFQSREKAIIAGLCDPQGECLHGITKRFAVEISHMISAAENGILSHKELLAAYESHCHKECVIGHPSKLIPTISLFYDIKSEGEFLDSPRGNIPSRTPKKYSFSPAQYSELLDYDFIPPQRHQRQRSKGYRTPPNTRYCGRPSKWANPYKVGTDGTREECVQKYRAKLAAMPKAERDAFLAPLRGYSYLSCFCPLHERCHVDTIIEFLE